MKSRIPIVLALLVVPILILFFASILVPTISESLDATNSPVPGLVCTHNCTRAGVFYPSSAVRVFRDLDKGTICYMPVSTGNMTCLNDQ